MIKFVILACLLALVHDEGVAGVQVAFDNELDITQVAEMSCAYNDDYLDFWVYGCPRTPSEEVYPDRTGFWTACNRDCSLIYHGGSLPKPAKLYIATYMDGLSAISMSGKNNPGDVGFVHDFGYIDSKDPVWCYNEIDLANFPDADASVINFTITGSSTGFVLIDKIVVDLGDQPLNPISIDSKDDELSQHWTFDDCHYLEDYHDFFAFGCPVEPEEGNPINDGAIGYWSPCTVATCKIEYSTSPSIIPTSVTIRGYIEGAALIKVVIPVTQKHEVSNVIETISASAVGAWVDYTVDLSSYQLYKIDVVLEVNAGVVVLDSISYNFTNARSSHPYQSELPICNRKDQTDPPTTATTPTTTTTVDPTATTTTVDPTATTTTVDPTATTTTFDPTVTTTTVDPTATTTTVDPTATTTPPTSSSTRTTTPPTTPTTTPSRSSVITATFLVTLLSSIVLISCH